MAKAKAAAAEAMDDADGGEQAAAPQAGKKLFGIPLKLLIIGAGALLVVGGGGGGYMMWSKSKAEAAKAAAAASAPVVKPPVFVDLPDVLVNLSSTGGERQQYLKIKIVLELSEQAMIQQIQPVMPRVMDAFQTYLRELRPVDLDGSAGLYRLKEELTRRVNSSIAPNRINAVLFKEIVVQ
jgi:flagellar FliL protein